MSEKQDNSSIIGQLPVVAPLLASAAAIAFDVGYFWGVDINYFTVFSLSEHLTFSFEALPVALFVAMASLLGLVIGMRAPTQIVKFDEGKKHLKSINLLYKYLPELLILCIVIYSFYLEYWEIAIAGVVALGEMILFDLVRDLRRDITALTLAWALLALVFSLLIGHLLARNYIALDSTRELYVVGRENGSNMTVRLIRSGERGILVFDPKERQLQFVLWKTVTLISRKK